MNETDTDRIVKKLEFQSILIGVHAICIMVAIDRVVQVLWLIYHKL